MGFTSLVQQGWRKQKKRKPVFLIVESWILLKAEKSQCERKIKANLVSVFPPSTFPFPAPISVQVVGMWKRREVYVCGRCEPISFMLGFGQYHQGQTTHLYCAPYRDLAQPLLFLRQRNKHCNGLSNSAKGSLIVPNSMFFVHKGGGRGYPKVGWLNTWTLNSPPRRFWRDFHWWICKQYMNLVSQFAPGWL